MNLKASARRALNQQLDLLYRQRIELREALHYARRFLNAEDHDTAYIDGVLSSTNPEGRKPVRMARPAALDVPDPKEQT